MALITQVFKFSAGYLISRIAQDALSVVYPRSFPSFQEGLGNAWRTLMASIMSTFPATIESWWLDVLFRILSWFRTHIEGRDLVIIAVMAIFYIVVTLLARTARGIFRGTKQKPRMRDEV